MKTRCCAYTHGPVEAEHTLHPISILTRGGWYPEAHQVILTLVALIASSICADYCIARGILFQMHAAVQMESNALCLLPDSEAVLRLQGIPPDQRKFVVLFYGLMLDFFTPSRNDISLQHEG